MSDEHDATDGTGADGTGSGGTQPGVRPTLTAIDGDRSADTSPEQTAEADIPAANDEAIRMRIAGLEEEHRDLDAAIRTMEERMPYDRLTIQRLKKRKLALKDQITELHEAILPDIIA